jgi:hypothetical protein
MSWLAREHKIRDEGNDSFPAGFENQYLGNGHAVIERFALNA